MPAGCGSQEMAGRACGFSGFAGNVPITFLFPPPARKFAAGCSHCRPERRGPAAGRDRAQPVCDHLVSYSPGRRKQRHEHIVALPGTAAPPRRRTETAPAHSREGRVRLSIAPPQHPSLRYVQWRNCGVVNRRTGDVPLARVDFHFEY